MNLRVELTQTGGPEVLEPRRAPMPSPGPGQVLVHVKLAGVNGVDLLQRSGAMERAPVATEPGEVFVPGQELAGVVLAVGEGVEQPRVGAHVLGLFRGRGAEDGGYQRLALRDAAALVAVPELLSLDEAGALGLPAVRAWLSLRALGAAPGRRVHVCCGADPAGFIAAQIAGSLGAEVLVSVPGAALVEDFAALGLAVVADRSAPGWAASFGEVDRLLDLSDGAGFGEAVAQLSSGAWVVFAGGPGRATLSLASEDLLRALTLTGWSMARATTQSLRRAVVAIAHLHADGALRLPRVSRFPLVDAAKAHAAIESGEVRGRVVLI